MAVRISVYLTEKEIKSALYVEAVRKLIGEFGGNINVGKYNESLVGLSKSEGDRPQDPDFFGATVRLEIERDGNG